MNKPTTAAGYMGNFADRARATCLYLATKLGDLLDDLVIVGGLVPSLLIQDPSLQAHVGTLDLDIGLTLGLLKEERYRTLTARLRNAGFHPDVNEEGNPIRQRWRIDTGVTVDFLIPPLSPDDRGGRLRNLERDFAAIIAPGLQVAFLDRLQITVTGQTVAGEQASRSLWVCGPGAYIVLKALAFHLRGENKDAYDLHYVIRNFPGGAAAVAAHLDPLLGDPDARQALEILRRDFARQDALGPRRVAEFLMGGPDEDLQADVVGDVGDLCRRFRSGTT